MFLLSRLPKTNLGYIATVVCDPDVTRWSGIRRLHFLPIAPIACFRMKLNWSIKRLCSASSKVAAQRNSSLTSRNRVDLRDNGTEFVVAVTMLTGNLIMSRLPHWEVEAVQPVACSSSSNSSFSFICPSECRSLRLLPDMSQTDPLSKKDENNNCFAL